MCGIVGIVQYESAIDRSVRQEALNILFSGTFLNTLPRGRDASGMFQVHRDGDWMMAKQGDKITDWLYQERNDKNPVIYRDFVESWLEHPQELAAVVGHCRAATVGSRGSDNLDNHPFAVQVDTKNALLLVHNGTLKNHEKIWDNLPQVTKRHGKVDSEVLAHFLFHLTQHGTRKIEEDDLKYFAKRVEGSYACIMVNTRFPDQVVAFRKERPMDIILIEPLNIAVLVSEKKHFEAALETYEFIRKMEINPHLPVLNTTDKVMPERDCLFFDTTLPWPKVLNFQSFKEVSTSGIMSPHGVTVIEEGWEAASSSTKTSTTQHPATGGNTQYYGNPQRVAKYSKAPKQIPANTGKSKDDVAVRTEGEIVEERTTQVSIELEEQKEAARAYETAKSLGLMVEFDRDSDLADVCGKSGSTLGAFEMGIANEVAKSVFISAYALARADNAAELKKAKDANRKLLDALEVREVKQSKAERKIWELKTIIQIFLSLRKKKFELTVLNLGNILESFPKLRKTRRLEVIETLRGIVSSKDTGVLLKQLEVRYEKLASRRRDHTTISASTEGVE